MNDKNYTLYIAPKNLDADFYFPVYGGMKQVFEDDNIQPKFLSLVAIGLVNIINAIHFMMNINYKKLPFNFVLCQSSEVKTIRKILREEDIENIFNGKSLESVFES